MKSDYKAIKGLGTGAGSFHVAMRVRLYEGPDHLLLVQNTGYTEDYRRVYYRDIRYVIARKNLSQGRQALLSGLLFLGVFALNLTSLPWWIPDLLSLPFLIWFVLNWVRGGTCECLINTDVQTLALPTPRRLSKVPVLIAFLNTKISPGQPDVAQVAA